MCDHVTNQVISEKIQRIVTQQRGNLVDGYRITVVTLIEIFPHI